MAEVIGGIGISHTPSMGVEYDRGMDSGFDPAWAPWFEGTRPVKAWLEEVGPDRIVIIYNDHLNFFQFEAYPTLAIGVADLFRQADEGWGLRDLPSLPSDSAFGWHLTNELVRGEFDMTVCQELAIDHGIYSWFPYLFDEPWSTPIHPIAVNLIRQPFPTSQRLHKLGLALRQAIEAWPAKERVLVIATGGMSHQIHGGRFGIANQDLDRFFLRNLHRHCQKLVQVPQERWMELGGVDAVELSIWFSMRGALSDDIAERYAFQTFPRITGCGVIVFEEPARHRANAPTEYFHE
jgi:protocatechuate 4,5-dioxygenase beta chain